MDTDQKRTAARGGAAPANEPPAPKSQRITAENRDSIKFPCWLRAAHKINPWWWRCTTRDTFEYDLGDDDDAPATHFHPDQETAPREVPETEIGIDVIDPQGGVATVSSNHPCLKPAPAQKMEGGEPLRGVLCRVGTPIEPDAITGYPRILISTDEESVQAVKTLPMLKPVVILEEKEYQALLRSAPPQPTIEEGEAGELARAREAAKEAAIKASELMCNEIVWEARVAEIIYRSIIAHFRP